MLRDGAPLRRIPHPEERPEGLRLEGSDTARGSDLLSPLREAVDGGVAGAAAQFVLAQGHQAVVGEFARRRLAHQHDHVFVLM